VVAVGEDRDRFNVFASLNVVVIPKFEETVVWSIKGCNELENVSIHIPICIKACTMGSRARFWQWAFGPHGASAGLELLFGPFSHPALQSKPVHVKKYWSV
jgi:hypothetical protein